MHTGLAVVLRAHGHTLGEESLAQLYVIDHIAIVRSDHIAIGIQVRLCVFLGGRPEGSPAQLRDAARTAHLGEVVALCHLIHAALIFTQVNLTAAERGCTHRIIAAVGKALGCVDKDGP
jgi:hypothetical protein